MVSSNVYMYNICIHLLTISKHLQPSLFDPSGRSLRPCPQRDRDGKACLEFKNGAGPWKLRGRHRRIWWLINVDHHFQAQSRVVCWIGWQPHVTVIFDPSPDCDNSLANEEITTLRGITGVIAHWKNGRIYDSETDSPGLRHAINHLRFVG